MNSKLRSEAFAEVEILAMLFHPNIISYFKHFIGDDTLYIELEYAKGGNLANMVKQQLNASTFFDEETVLWFFYQLASAIEYIHEIGIMHRDIKTLNIFFMQSGLLKLGDFGIAKILDSNMDLAETQVGTPLYMSPEIIEGKKYSNKSDLWALGCVMYEVCTLTRVFDATNQLKLAYRISLCEVLPIASENYSSDLRFVMSKENIPYNLYVILVLEYVSFPFSFIYICSTQSWNLNNLGIFSTNYIIIVKKYFMRPNKIYIFRISSTRSTKWCKNLSQIFQ